MYLDYQKLKVMIEDFKENQKKGFYCKLPGYYVFTKHKAIIALNVFDMHQQSVSDNEDIACSIEDQGEIDQIRQDLGE